MSHRQSIQPPHSHLQVMHIASGDRWGGAEAQLCTLLGELQQLPGITVRAVLMNDAETAARLRQSGAPIDVLDETRLGGLAILRGLRRLLRQHRPHLLHTHRLKENILGSLANLSTVRAPSLRTSHGAPEHPPTWHRPHKRLIHTLDWLCGRYLQQGMIAVSRDLAGQLSGLYPLSHIHVIENGIALQEIPEAPADFRVQQPDALHIGLVGRLDPVKRVDLFLQMAAALLREPGANQPPMYFHIFGEGALRPLLETQARELGLDGHLHFHGHRQDIQHCLASLDAVVMCSDHEGLPMTLLESIAAGTPVIAHRVGGMVEVLDAGHGGILVDHHSGHGYAQAVRDLLTRTDRTQLVARGQAHVREHFSAAANAERTAALYRRLAGVHQG